MTTIDIPPRAGHAHAVQGDAVAAEVVGTQIQQVAGRKGECAVNRVEFAIDAQTAGSLEREVAVVGERPEIGDDVVAIQGHLAARVSSQAASVDDAGLLHLAGNRVAGCA